MITLKQWMETVAFRLTEGSDFSWECYGPNAYSLDSWNGDHNGHSFCIIFDTKDQTVYEVQAHDYANNRAYRMINPDFAKKYKKEAKRRDCDRNEAWENVDYVDLELEEDWLRKAEAIFQGVEYDTRISVPLDLDDDLMFELMKMAHERDVTLNKMVEIVLLEVIAKHDGINLEDEVDA